MSDTPDSPLNPLPSGNPDGTDREAVVDAAIAEYLRAGGEPGGFDVGGWLARYPDATDELAEFLRDEGVFGRLASPLLPPREGTAPSPAPDATTGASGDPGPGAADDPTGRAFGDFEILGVVAEGGMGVVFRARQRSLNRVVALKMVRGERASRKEIDRFRREAEAVAALDHPNIVPVYEVGEHDDRPFFAMKLIAGGSLADRLKEFAGRSREAAALVAAVARAVDHAHRRGVLHRDLKPSNVLLDEAGAPHVTDFGLARRLESGPGDTASGAVVGTPAYMAPEQARGEKGPTTAVDVFGLGAVLYALLTGGPPFKAGSAAETLLLALRGEPARPRSVRPAVDRDLETVCLKCLEKDPTRRYESAAAVADDLDRWLRGEPILARPTGPVGRLTRWVQRKPTLATAYALTLAVVALAAVGAVIASLWRAAEAAKSVAEDARAEAEGVRDALAVQKKAADDARQAAELARDGEEEARLEASRQRDRFEWLEYGRTMQVAHQEWRENNVPAALVLLKGTRPDFRGWEWDYLQRLCHADLLTLVGHAGEVTAASYSPDGSRIVTASRDKTARVWDATTGATRLTLEGHSEEVVSASYNPDGSRIVTASRDKTVRVWDATTGEQLLKQSVDFSISGGTSWGIAASFNPDGSRIAIAAPGGGGPIRIVHARTGKPLLEIKGRLANLAPSVSWSPDESRVVTAGYHTENTARVWDTTSGVELLVLKGHAAQVTTASFNRDASRIVTGSRDGTAKVWDARTGLPVITFTGHTGPVSSTSWSADGSRVVTAGTDATVRVWDATSGKELLTLKAPVRTVNAAAFSPDGLQVVSGGGDRAARVWDAARTVEAVTLKGHHDHHFFDREGSVQSASWSANGSLVVTGGTDGTARVWEVGTGKESRVLRDRPMSGGIISTSFSPDDARIVTIEEGRVVNRRLVWDVTAGKVLFSLTGQAVRVNSASYSPDGSRIVTGGEDGTVTLWNGQNGTEILTLGGHKGRTGAPAWSRDGSRIVTGGADKTVRIWDATTGKVLLIVEGGIDPVSFSPDGSRVVSGCPDNAARVWDARSGAELLILKGHTDRITSASWSPDGSRIVTGSDDRTARVWDAATGAEVLTLKGHTGGVTRASFSPDGSKILTASLDNTARVWDARPVNREFFPREVAPHPRPVK